MKYVVPLALVLLVASAVVGCARKPMTPVTPWADLVDDSLNFFTTTTDPGGSMVCYIFDWGDGRTTTTDYVMSGDTIWCTHVFLGTGSRYIKVKARSEKGYESRWSPTLRFHNSEPPELDEIVVGPSHWAVDRWYRLSVRVTDPNGDSVAVKFLWGDLPAGGWSAFVPSGSVITDSCRWSVIGEHTVLALLKDKGCMISEPVELEAVSVSPMAVLWTNLEEERYYDATPTLGSIAGQPVLYCKTTDAVDCYSLEGRMKWRAALATGTGYAGSLSSDGSSLYLTDYDEGLVCVDAATGRRKWSLALSDATCTPAVGPDGAIYVTALDSDRSLKRVSDRGDSAIVEWTSPVGDNSLAMTGPVIDRNGTVYITGYDNGLARSTLVAFDAGGTVLWKDSTHGWGAGSPVIDSRNRIIITDENGYLYCFNPDGTSAWSVLTNQLWPSCAAVGRNDQIIVTDYCGYVTCFDSDGRQQWQTPLEICGGNTPCITDSVIIVGDPESYLYGLSANNGLVLWTFSMWDSLDYARRRAPRSEGDCIPSTVVGPSGDLYLACEDGLFWVSSSDLRMANTAWPTYNHDAARSGWAGRP